MDEENTTILGNEQLVEGYSRIPNTSLYSREA